METKEEGQFHLSCWHQVHWCSSRDCWTSPNSSPASLRCSYGASGWFLHSAPSLFHLQPVRWQWSNSTRVHPIPCRWDLHFGFHPGGSTSSFVGHCSPSSRDQDSSSIQVQTTINLISEDNSINKYITLTGPSSIQTYDDSTASLHDAFDVPNGGQSFRIKRFI